MPGSTSSQKGAVAIYIALLTATIITAAAVVLSGVLSVQLRLVNDIVSSERAFYAADSGIEETQFRLYELQRDGTREGELTVEDGEVPYDDENAATYETRGVLVPNEDVVYNCIASEGFHTDDQRRITIRPQGCEI